MPPLSDIFKLNTPNPVKPKLQQLAEQKPGSLDGADMSYIRELALQLSSGTPEQQLQADIEIKKIADRLDEDGRGQMDQFISNVVAESIENQSGKKLDIDQRKLIMDTVKTNVGMGVLKAGAGLIQVLDAAAKKKKLRMPEMPDVMTKDPLLQNELGRALSRQDQGDTALQQFFKERSAEAEKAAIERAKVTGNVGQYLSGSQAAQLASNRAAREFAEDDALRRSGLRGETRQLLGMSMQEDQRIQNDMWRRFSAKESRFREQAQALRAQREAGFSNMFTGLEDIGANLPYLLQKVKQQVDTPGSPIVSTPLDPLDLPGLEGNLQAPPRPLPSMSGGQTEDMSMLEMTLMGNDAYRTEDRVKSFQESLKNQGFQDVQPTGEWDSATQAGFENFANPLMLRFR